MKTLAFFAASLATPALAHPGTNGVHMPHWTYIAVVVALGIALAVRNARKG